MRGKFKFMYHIIISICILLIGIYIISDLVDYQINKFLFSIFILISILFCVILKLILIRMSEVDEINSFYTTARGNIILSLNKKLTMKELNKEIESVNNLDNEIESVNESDEEIESVNEINNTSDILELMLINMKEIKEYYVLSKTMAKRSFLLSVIMCIFGFIIISASIIAIFIIDISLVQSIVPIIGGAVVEAIAGTSLVVYKKSLDQLNQYYEALHNNERYLSLVNLVEKLTDDKKNEIYISIINSQLEKLK